MHCTASGCYYYNSGDDPDNECYGTGTCGGTCNGSGGCQYPSTSVTCSSLQDCDYLNYYYQSPSGDTPTGEDWCWYRDYADTYQYCNGSGSCSALNCSSYEAVSKYGCGTCKYIPSNYCTGSTQGSCANYSLGTSCGSNQECNGSGTCLDCAYPSGTISASKTTVQPGEQFTITITGYDNYDVWQISSNEGSNSWNSGSAQTCLFNQTSCGKSWDYTKTTPGTYTFYGRVRDSDDVQGCSGYHETGIGSVTVTVSKKANGESCSVAGECQSGYCVDGVCCSGSCSGTCVTCYFSATYKGDCYYITAGEDPANECYGTGTCGGTCNGSGGCQYPSTSVTCSSLQDCDYLNYYYQSGTESPTATENCYYRDYADTYQYCNGSGSCSTLNCSAYSNPLQYSCGTCKYISSSNCTGATLGSCSNYTKGTSCDSSKECDGNGNCVNCANPSGTISTSKTTVQAGEQFTISVTGYDDYDVWYLYTKEGAGGTWQSQQCVGNQTSCTKTWNFTKTTAGTYQYYGWVIDSDDVNGCAAYHESATSPSYVEVTVTPSTCAGPTTPVSPCSEQSAHAIKFSWDAVSGATSYRLEWCNASYDFGSASCCTGSCYGVTSATNYYVSGLNTGTSYKFRVRVESASGCATPGNWSSTKQCGTTAQDVVDCNNECYRRGYAYQADCYPLIGGYIPCGQSQTDYADPIGKYGACSGLFVGGCVCCHNCPSSPPSDYVTVGSCSTSITGKGWDATDGVIFGYRHLDKDTTWRKFSMDDNPGDSTCGDNIELQNSWTVSGDTITVQTDVLGKSATHSLGGGFNFSPGSCKYTVSKVGVAASGNETYTSTGACMTGTNALGITGGAEPGEYVRWFIDMEYCGDGETSCGEVCDPTTPGQSNCKADCSGWGDNNPPVVTIVGLDKASDPNAWLNSNFQVSLRFTELNGGDSGLDTCQYKIMNFGTSVPTLDLTSAVSCNSMTDSGSVVKTITVGSSGQCRIENSSGCTIEVYATDKAGKVASTTRSFKIDWTPPATEIK